ncbi:MAG TPA: hypothetical protein VGD71_08200 [Kribbella sp.]
MKDKFRVTRRAGQVLGTVAAASAIAASAVAASVANAGPAQAATNPYTAAGVCGSSYHELEHHSISGAVIYLMWNGADNCVATIKTSNIGKKTETEAILEVQSPRGFYADDDSYAYYAVIAEHAAGSCIKWGGMTTQIWESAVWDHCG